MPNLNLGRRAFIKKAGASVLACGCATVVPFANAHAQQSCTAQSAASQAKITPAMALDYLKAGNERFVSGQMRNCDLKAQVEATGSGQWPFAAIVGCIDSRESATMTFDQAVGDVFAARIAGNFVNDDILGSLEFACAAAGARVVLVVGHSDCGAIRGAIDNVVLGNLTFTLANLMPAVAAVEGFEGDRTSSNEEFVQKVAEKNVELTLERLRQRSTVLRDLESAGDLGVHGAMYDTTTGRVAFL